MTQREVLRAQTLLGRARTRALTQSLVAEGVPWLSGPQP